MLTNPDHEKIKQSAAAMLEILDHTPDEPQRVLPELLPIAEFTNGRRRPNNKPPVAVYVTLDGVRWRKQRDGNWHKS